MPRGTPAVDAVGVFPSGTQSQHLNIEELSCCSSLSLLSHIFTSSHYHPRPSSRDWLIISPLISVQTSSAPLESACQSRRHETLLGLPGHKTTFWGGGREEERRRRCKLWRSCLLLFPGRQRQTKEPKKKIYNRREEERAYLPTTQTHTHQQDCGFLLPLRSTHLR